MDGYLAGLDRDVVARRTIDDRTAVLIARHYSKESDYAARKDEYDALARTEAIEQLGEVVDAKVRFLGVWETVLTLGRKRNPRHLGDRPSPRVEHARQALALDERRSDFRPHIWKERSAPPCEQSLRQRWFAGVHSNVGGGYVDDGLANEALKWMLREARDVGLDLDWEFLSHYPDHERDKLYDSRKGIWRLLSWLHFWQPSGVRDPDPAALGLNADRAELELHPSVIVRMTLPRKEFEFPEDYPYRPAKLLGYLNPDGDDEAYLERIKDLPASEVYPRP